MEDSVWPRQACFLHVSWRGRGGEMPSGTEGSSAWPWGPPRPSPADGPGQVVSPSGIGGDQGLLTPLEWGAHQAAHPVFLAWMTFKSQVMSQENPNSQLVLKNETGPALLQDEPWVGLPH